MRKLLGSLMLLAVMLLASIEPAASRDANADLESISQPQAGAAPGSTAALGVEELLDQLNVPGVSISVIWNFAVHWSKGFGTADALSPRPVTPRTLFQAASISKPVTAVAAVLLAEANQLDLDADVSHFLKSWALPQSNWRSTAVISPRMLLSHTAGLPKAAGFGGYWSSEALPNSQQILDGQEPSTSEAFALNATPMSRSAYSGIGTLVMQVLLEDLSSTPFTELMQTLVLKPLQMNDSRFQQPLQPQYWPQAAVAHDAKGERLQEPWKIYPELAAAGLWSSSADLAKLVVAIQRAAAGQTAEPITRATTQQLFQPVGVGSFGTGFNVFRQGEGWYFAHMGANAGYRSVLMAHQRKGYGVVVMTNGSNGNAVIEELCRRVQQRYGWDVGETTGEFRYASPKGFGCLPEF